MKNLPKLLGSVTTILLLVIVILQGSPAGDSLNEFIERYTSALGVGATGYGLAVIVMVANYVRAKFGIDVAKWLLQFVKNEDAEEWAAKLLGSETAKSLLVQRDEFLEEQKEDLERAIIDKQHELLDLKAKLKNGVLEGPEAEKAKLLIKRIEAWLDEKDTETD